MSGPVVAVIGAGFSGLLTTLNLLRFDPKIEVRLIERRGVFGLGLAYATGNPKHLLNVRLNNMSAYPDQPRHLADWLADQPGWSSSDDFITRESYGLYLTDLLCNAIDDSASTARLKLIEGTAKVARLEGDGWRVELDQGQTVFADAVVLAQGNLSPLLPPNLAPEVVASGQFINDPWSALHRVPNEAENLLLIGSGLTMVDAVISLRQAGRRFTAVSRRGLIPRSHGPGQMAPARRHFSGSPLSVLRQVRAVAQTEDWRGVVDDLRHSARELWASWDDGQRGRFIRHGRGVWDNHRHRLAPAVSREVTGMLASEELWVEAGRIQGLRLAGNKVEVDIRLRGSQATVQRHYDAVINCSGPQEDVVRSPEPLLRQMLDHGLVTTAPLGLGLALDARGHLRDGQGRPHPHLFAIGTLTRSLFWETTAVPDLREQAVILAQTLIQSLGTKAAKSSQSLPA